MTINLKYLAKASGMSSTDYTNKIMEEAIEIGIVLLLTNPDVVYSAKDKVTDKRYKLTVKEVV